MDVKSLLTIQHNNNRATTIGFIGMVVCMGVFFVALFAERSVFGYWILIYPLSLLLGFFFVGYAIRGKVVAGVVWAAGAVLAIVGAVVLEKLVAAVINLLE